MKSSTESLTLQNLVEGLLFSLQVEGRAPRTIGYYKDLLNTFLSYTQKHDIISVDVVGVKEVRQLLSWVGSRIVNVEVGNDAKTIKQAKPSTAYPYFRALRRLFNWAIQEGYISISPLANIHFKPPAPPIIEGYRLEELQRHISICDFDMKMGSKFTGVRNKAMLLLFIDSGLRRTEMAELKLIDLNLDN
jgi:site-specific recombinase XerD